MALTRADSYTDVEKLEQVNKIFTEPVKIRTPAAHEPELSNPSPGDGGDNIEKLIREEIMMMEEETRMKDMEVKQSVQDANQESGDGRQSQAKQLMVKPTGATCIEATSEVQIPTIDINLEQNGAAASSQSYHLTKTTHIIPKQAPKPKPFSSGTIMPTNHPPRCATPAYKGSRQHQESRKKTSEIKLSPCTEPANNQDPNVHMPRPLLQPPACNEAANYQYVDAPRPLPQPTVCNETANNQQPSMYRTAPTCSNQTRAVTTVLSITQKQKAPLFRWEPVDRATTRNRESVFRAKQQFEDRTSHMTNAVVPVPRVQQEDIPSTETPSPRDNTCTCKRGLMKSIRKQLSRFGRFIRRKLGRKNTKKTNNVSPMYAGSD